MSDQPDETRAQPEGSLEAEGSGETVGEAKWTALRELERRFPDLDKGKVEFVVLAEGERGLLGVGFVPARVLARLTEPPPPAAAPPPSTATSPAATRLRELLELVRRALGVDATVSVEQADETLVANFHGHELGLVIGKHGQTIDAIQYLAAAVLSHEAGERTDVVVDAAGYRARRRRTLEAIADRAAGRAAATGTAIALDPMSAAERKVVHERLKERGDVATASAGAEPNRHVVIRPAG